MTSGLGKFENSFIIYLKSFFLTLSSKRWFGTPPYSSYQRDNYADLGHENYQLPTAYVGRNLHIEKVLNVSVASTDDFYTRVLLPWRVYDGMKITFSKWSGFGEYYT